MIRSGWHEEWDVQLASLPARRRVDEMAACMAPLNEALQSMGLSLRDAAARFSASLAALRR